MQRLKNFNVGITEMNGDFQNLTDEELISQYQNFGDPVVQEAIRLEQNRRHNQKIEKKAATANNIAIGSLVVAI